MLAYLSCAAGWLLIGTSIGEYIGIKFVAPDADHVSWLSFGRLRPVHTNMVFWGWASLGMLGLGYYIVPRVSNTPLHNIKRGYQALILINAAVLIGSLCLMAGINNAGGEYREYTWPVMALFAAGLVLTLNNFIKTVAKRTTTAIYISNWYIISAIIFVLVIVIIAYSPWWQDGLGETIIQGYYMHMGVGMWFMFLHAGHRVLLPSSTTQQADLFLQPRHPRLLVANSFLHSHRLAPLHLLLHPLWLQTVAIIGSMGMIIPVTAGATNFLLTIKGSWSSIGNSYTLPFFLTGIIFYFVGSMQGTAEAFRSTNLIWHFTDFTVAHSHLTMYGIITFFIWAATYALVPRLTGKEAPQIAIGTHFWLALLGLLFYTIPLMWGATLKGLSWGEGKPFIDGVVLMAPYWLWRAIGGSLMWFSHIVFCYNMYRMIEGSGVLTFSGRSPPKRRGRALRRARRFLRSLTQPRPHPHQQKSKGMEFFDNHKQLFRASFLFFLTLSLFVAILPALNNQRNNAPLPGSQPLSADAEHGKKLYIANGCVACHTQQVRNVDMDKSFGARPSISATTPATIASPFGKHRDAHGLGTHGPGPDKHRQPPTQRILAPDASL